MCLVEVSLGYAFYLLAHGGAEEQRTMIGGNSFKYRIQILLESHGKHFIGLIEDNIMHEREIGHSTVHQVHKSSWRSHHDVHTMPESTHLRFDTSTAIYRQNGNMRQIT